MQIVKGSDNCLFGNILGRKGRRIMDYIDILKSFGDNVKSFIPTKNYYYENHNCGSLGNTKRVQLDYILSDEKTDKVLRFGICSECGACFYHYDYISKGL